MNPNTPITESIDQRILKLLGLEETFDLDYGTYFTLLREALVKYASIGKEKIPAEDLELLKNELKRVRVKEKKKKFKITSENLFNKKPPRTAKISKNKLLPSVAGVTKISTNKLLPFSKVLEKKDGTTEAPEQIIKKQPTNILSKIDEKLASILDTLVSISKLEDKKIQLNRRERENKRRQERESGLEKGGKLITGAVKKMLAPFQNIFDRILNFIFFTLLGRAFTMLMNWLGDPKNKKKVETLGRFLKDWWPALLAGIALFMTPFGGFVKGVVTIVAGFSSKVIKLIPTLVGIIKNLGKGAVGVGRFAAANPVASLVTVGAVAAGTGAYMASQQNEQKRTQVDPNAVTPKQTREEGKTPGASQLMREQILQRGIGGFSRGAKIEGGYNGVDKNTGIPITGAGRDTQLIAARTGEIVLTPEDRTDIYNKTGYDIADQVKNRKPNFVDSGKIKLFGNTSLMSIGGILGFSKGGMIGEMPISFDYGQKPDDNQMRRAARLFADKSGSSLRFGTEDELFKAFKKLGYIPDIQKMVGKDNFLRIQQGLAGSGSSDGDALEAIRKSVAEKLKAVNKPQSFTQSSRAAAGLDDLAKKFDMDAKTAPRYAENLPKLNNPKTRVTRVGPNRMLPAAGGSSANAMRAAAKATRNVRPPIPKTSAIVPYTGGGLARTGVTGGLSVPQIRTNMKVPGGFGNLKSLGVELLLNYLVQSGLDYVEAKRLASTIEKARKESPEKLAERIEKLREIVDKEERYQKSFGGILDKVIKLGGETGSERLSRQAKTILAGVGAKTFQGGAIRGGYELKDQSFKDAPKTQIMTDDKGRPFVGYKAMRGGKLVYVRGPKAGEGTSNPLEALGRMINPNAYKANDERLERGKFKEALVNSLESLQARGASIETQKKIMKQMGGNLKDVQNDLNYRRNTQPKVQAIPKPKPKPKPRPKSRPAGGGMGGGRGSGSSLGGVKRRQGGGSIEGGVSPAEIEKAYINARKNKTLPPELLLELGREASDAMYGPGATQGGGNWRPNKGSGVTDYYGNAKPLRKFGGGFLDITSNFGDYTTMFGADNRFSNVLNTAFQQGEGLLDFDYVLTKSAMMNGAREQLSAFAQQLNANDPGSNARKQGIVPKKATQPDITPYSTESVASMITLPQIKRSSGGMRSPASPTAPAAFSAIPNDSVASEMRSTFSSMYGIVG